MCTYTDMHIHIHTGCVEVYRGSQYPVASTPDNDEQMRANLLIVKYLANDGGHYQALVPKPRKAKGPSRSSGTPIIVDLFSVYIRKMSLLPLVGLFFLNSRSLLPL